MSKHLLWIGLVLPGLLPAEVHRVVATTYYRTFSRAHPVFARVKTGDTIITKTLDSGGQDEKGVRRHPEPGNPLTGHFYVEGAEPGGMPLFQGRGCLPER